MPRWPSDVPQAERESAVEFGFVAGLVTMACIIALTSLGDSLIALKSSL